MKYIVIQETHYSMIVEHPIIFPEILIHSGVADSLLHMMRVNSNHKFEVISAGFVNLDVWECYGRSESLNLDSRKEDTALIANIE